ncbi:hypothetical protein SAMN04488128_105161 [Chitinophaga eiseniae]|uniref:Uncharacterized protein n=1 Tax=Chitinophaga eiseniae TaxID=634771 RepID=A0A1T4TIK8_9BACT|nr:hypothetical protein SAMN04488128_105161 [Chitinophaga eiseniae]
MPGSTHSVEFDFMQDLHTRINTTITGISNSNGFRRAGDFILVFGSVESIGHDDMICLRVDTSCIIMAYRNDALICMDICAVAAYST